MNQNIMIRIEKINGEIFGKLIYQRQSIDDNDSNTLLIGSSEIQCLNVIYHEMTFMSFLKING
jgi:hypothetical protein